MERVKVYDDPKLFWSDVSPYLKKEEAKNCLCLGLSYGFQSQSIDCMYQSALFKEDQRLGALLVSRFRINQTLLPSPVSGLESAKVLFDEFCKKRISINGIVGEKETANLYRQLLEKRGEKTKIHMTQGLYKCVKVKMPESPNDLFFRKAEEKDVEKIGEWIESFHSEAVPHDPPINGIEVAKSKIDNNMIYVVECDSKLVSMAGWSRDIETSCSVNLVFTPKQFRKNGYASVVTAKLTQHLLNSGKGETNLYTDKTNSTSNKIYVNVGYNFVCDSVHFGIVERHKE